MSLTVRQRYSGPAIVLHWIIAVLIVANILIVWTVDSLPKGAERPMIDLHKSFGLTVLGLAVLRIIWRFVRTPPPLPAGYAPWEKRASHYTHWILYGLIFLMPLSGWAHDSAWKDAASHPLNLYWVIPFFRIGFIQGMDPATKETLHSAFDQIHTSLAYVLYAMVAVHLVGALKHQFIDKEPELQRMGIGRF
jgi:cytochrome b561